MPFLRIKKIPFYAEIGEKKSFSVFGALSDSESNSKDFKEIGKVCP